jgi:S-DNA-T family DNA segregation ATPase FtsK/SpoIIIE
MNIDEATNTLNNLFSQFKIKANVKSCKIENSFILFDVSLCAGGTVKQVEKYSTEIALALKSQSNALIYPITKEGIIRIEVMLCDCGNVYFQNLKRFVDSTYTLPIIIGKKRDGSNLIVDLINMPHLLIGGTTGSGKSIFLHSIINSLMFVENVKFALVDTKRIEFSYYNTLNNLYAPVAKDSESSITLLTNLVNEMESRFSILEQDGCRNISEYEGKMDYIVLVIDELSDLIMSSKKIVQDLLCRLAQKSRACGIHIVAATQRPSSDVVTGTIKVNFPVRIAFQVGTSVDSRVILERSGAEKLSGKGDGIIDGANFKFERFKGAFIREQDINENVRKKNSWRKQIWNSLL